MGGKIASSVGRAAKANGTEITVFVAMSADPPLPGFLPAANAASIKLDKDGYADRTSIYDWFLDAISEQDRYNGHTIISKDTYVEQFLGSVPIDLIDTGTVYKDGQTGSGPDQGFRNFGRDVVRGLPFSPFSFTITRFRTSRMCC